MSKFRAYFFALLFLLLLAALSFAQTQQYRLQWDQPEALSVAQEFTYTLKVDAAAPVTLTPICSALAGVPGLLTRCVVPLPAMSSGPHTLVVAASNAFGTTNASPLNGAPPSQPANVIITINITIK